MTTSTPERLLDAALSLFAERGFAATTVGDVEEAAGFTRRGGAVYKHFRSKEELFDAVINRHAETIEAAGDLSDLLPLGDLRAELTLVARFLLAELTNHEQVHRVLERADASADASRELMLQRVIEPSYRRLGDLLQRWVGDRPLEDSHATMMLLLGGLVNMRRNLWTFGRVPLDLDDERAIRLWVDIAETAIRGLGDAS
jgi:AcrR family transcriptional regulator